MSSEVRLVRILLRMYPASWRREYGEEIESLAMSQPLVSTAADLMVHAVRQHLRENDPWKISGWFLCLWACFWIVWNSIAPLSPSEYALFNRLEGIVSGSVLAATGYWTFFRGQSGIWQCSYCSIKACINGHHTGGGAYDR